MMEIVEFENANRDYAVRRMYADGLEFERPTIKDEAIRRLMVPSGEEKPLSYSKAETLVETDTAYADHCRQIRQARYEEQVAWGKMIVAKFCLTREAVA